MRILHVLDHSIPLHSGYTFRTRAILEQQRSFGWETFQITSSKHKISTALVEECDGFRFFRTPKPGGLFARLPVLNQLAVVNSLANRLAEVVEEIKPDLIHAHSPSLNGLAALRVAQWSGLPVVYECRAFWEDAAVDHGTSREGGLRYLASRVLETYVFKKVQAITTICEGLRKDIIARGIAEQKITVIPNAVDIQKFPFAGKPDLRMREEMKLAGNTVLGFIGSFYAYEGLSLMLEAMPAIIRERPDVRLLLVGGGPQETYLKEQAERLQLAGHVIFTGRVPHDRVKLYYDQIDLLVYPRYSMRLTNLVTPLKPLEAMAQGRLVVASDVGGHREMIEDGKTGWLFQAGDCDQLARKILSVLSQPQTWPAIKEEGRRFVEMERNWTESVKRYERVYAAALASSKGIGAVV